MPMEPEKNELSDAELDGLLQTWEAPHAPKSMRAAVFPAESGGWRKFWSGSLRIPIPALCVLVLLAALVFWKWPGPRVIVQTQRVEVPVEKTVTVYRDRIIRAPASSSSPTSVKLQPATNLNLRIIRRADLEDTNDETRSRN
jgi:hypothetical protein